MRRVLQRTRKLEYPLSTTPARPTPSICLFCQQHNTHKAQQRSDFTTSTPRLAAFSDQTLQKWRRKIWGTDKPPGYDDPYTGRNFDGSQEPHVIGGEADTAPEQALEDARYYEKVAYEEDRAAFQATVDEAPKHKAYVPAETWAGLEMVGGERDWDSGHEFQGHLSPHKLQTEPEILTAIYRATVEVYTKVSLKLPLTSIPSPTSIFNETSEVVISPGPDSIGAIVKFPSQEVKDIVVQSISEVETLESSTESAEYSTTEEEHDYSSGYEGGDAEYFLNDYTPQALRKSMNTWDPNWRDISLADPAIKLAIVSRTSQLIGYRIPDTLIATSKTCGTFARNLTATLNKPETLYDTLKTSKLLKLKNVSVSPTRETFVDKEKNVGRWKVIEEELTRRGLPVTGR